MIDLAESLNCESSDLGCLCLNPDFSYGIRDCTNEYCTDAKDAEETQAWAVNICASMHLGSPLAAVVRANFFQLDQGIAITSENSENAATTVTSGTTVVCCSLFIHVCDGRLTVNIEECYGHVGDVV